MGVLFCAEGTGNRAVSREPMGGVGGLRRDFKYVVCGANGKEVQ